MVELLGSVGYYTLDELQATYKPNHPDVLSAQEKYGNDISFQRVVHPSGVIPGFELRWLKILKEDTDDRSNLQHV